MNTKNEPAGAPAPCPTDGAVYQFRKNAVEVVQAHISYFRGHTLADVRVYFEAEDGSYRPTKKGLAIGLDLLPELKAAVAALEKAAAREIAA